VDSPAVPAEPLLGPIRRQITHMVPMDFPLLLIAPAFVIDLAAIGPEEKAWFMSVSYGVIFFVVLLVAQFGFSYFLMSRWSINPIFATDNFDYAMPNTWYKVRRDFYPWDATEVRCDGASWSPSCWRFFRRVSAWHGATGCVEFDGDQSLATTLAPSAARLRHCRRVLGTRRTFDVFFAGRPGVRRAGDGPSAGRDPGLAQIDIRVANAGVRRVTAQAAQWNSVPGAPRRRTRLARRRRAGLYSTQLWLMTSASYAINVAVEARSASDVWSCQ
jgi:hypothetical protein